MNQQNKKEKITTIPELAVLINNSFQDNQEYMDKRFGDMDKRFGDMDKRFDEVKKELKGEIKKVDTKLTNFIDDYNSEKLPMRVEYIENVLNLPKR